MELNGKQIVVVGLARTGVSVARFLVARGARVVATSESEPRQRGRNTSATPLLQ